MREIIAESLDTFVLNISRFLIEIGIISQVFQTEFGFHFLEVLGKRNHELTDQLIEDKAYEILYSRKFDEELENTLRTMRAEAFIEFKELD